MSSVYLLAGLGATFGAVVLTGAAVQSSVSQRRRALELLQSQVQEVSTDLREREMAQPFFERAFVPLVTKLGRLSKRLTPVGMRDRIARQLILAGSPEALDADKVAALKVFGSLGGAMVGFVLSILLQTSGRISIAIAAFLALFCYLTPGAGLGQRAIHRQNEIRKSLPDTMDLLTISVEAGLGFDAALGHVRRNVPGALSEELGRMMQEMQLGVTRATAFRHLAERSDVDELKAFVLAMIQADGYGISIAKVLRAQAKELRMRRRQRAEELAMKVPLKLLFPLIFGFLPAMFVVLVGPGVIRVIHSFLGLGP
jgi:tight adherence protein C